jgi:hypothetical protein
MSSNLYMFPLMYIYAHIFSYLCTQSPPYKPRLCLSKSLQHLIPMIVFSQQLNHFMARLPPTLSQILLTQKVQSQSLLNLN